MAVEEAVAEVELPIVDEAAAVEEAVAEVELSTVEEAVAEVELPIVEEAVAEVELPIVEEAVAVEEVAGMDFPVVEERESGMETDDSFRPEDADDDDLDDDVDLIEAVKSEPSVKVKVKQMRGAKTAYRSAKIIPFAKCDPPPGASRKRVPPPRVWSGPHPRNVTFSYAFEDADSLRDALRVSGPLNGGEFIQGSRELLNTNTRPRTAGHERSRVTSTMSHIENAPSPSQPAVNVNQPSLLVEDYDSVSQLNSHFGEGSIGTYETSDFNFRLQQSPPMFMKNSTRSSQNFQAGVQPEASLASGLSSSPKRRPTTAPVTRDYGQSRSLKTPSRAISAVRTTSTHGNVTTSSPKGVMYDSTVSLSRPGSSKDTKTKTEVRKDTERFHIGYSLPLAYFTQWNERISVYLENNFDSIASLNKTLALFQKVVNHPYSFGEKVCALVITEGNLGVIRERSMDLHFTTELATVSQTILIDKLVDKLLPEVPAISDNIIRSEEVEDAEEEDEELLRMLPEISDSSIVSKDDLKERAQAHPSSFGGVNADATAQHRPHPVIDALKQNSGGEHREKEFVRQLNEIDEATGSISWSADLNDKEKKAISYTCMSDDMAEQSLLSVDLNDRGMKKNPFSKAPSQKDILHGLGVAFGSQSNPLKLVEQLAAHSIIKSDLYSLPPGTLSSSSRSTSGSFSHRPALSRSASMRNISIDDDEHQTLEALMDEHTKEEEWIPHAVLFDTLAPSQNHGGAAIGKYSRRSSVHLNGRMAEAMRHDTAGTIVLNRREARVLDCATNAVKSDYIHVRKTIRKKWHRAVTMAIKEIRNIEPNSNP